LAGGIARSEQRRRVSVATEKRRQETDCSPDRSTKEASDLRATIQSWIGLTKAAQIRWNDSQTTGI
jgi:hypothetical protein